MRIKALVLNREGPFQILRLSCEQEWRSSKQEAYRRITSQPLAVRVAMQTRATKLRLERHTDRIMLMEVWLVRRRLAILQVSSGKKFITLITHRLTVRNLLRIS